MNTICELLSTISSVKMIANIAVRADIITAKGNRRKAVFASVANSLSDGNFILLPVDFSSR
jgi:hypothetical protein